MPLEAEEIFATDPSDSWKCQGCGCSNARACPGGCYWVSPDKCSACFDDDGARLAVGCAGDERFGVELCPAADFPAPHMPLFDSETTCYCARCQARLAA